MKLGSFLFLALSFFAPVFVQAQSTGSFDGLLSSITLDVSPDYPQPDELVTVSINDFSSGVPGAEIRWFINDTPVPNTENLRTISITAGATNSRSVIKAILTPPEGSPRTVTRTITPLYLDIIVEPQTHVPEFYRGRALASIDGQVNVTALLSDTALMSPDLIYTWRINDEVFDAGPIRGRNSISFIASQDSYNTVSLEVANLSGEILTQRTILIPVVFPKVVFYEDNPLYGLSLKAIMGEFLMTGNSATIRATPYYLSSTIFNNPDVLTWEINNESAQSNFENPYNMDLEKTGVPGRATIDFRVQSLDQLLQGGTGSIDINL